MSTAVNAIWSQAQRDEIAKELACVLKNPKFATSQRCTSLLRHPVEHALDGNLDHIKERTLGIEVFQRNPNYDVNTDPIVRRIASETRKRLAQHYRESSQHTIRIRLEAGSYLPHVDSETPGMFGSDGQSNQPSQLPLAHEHLLDSGIVHQQQIPQSISRGFRHKWFLLGGVALLISALCFWAAHSDFFRPTSYLVWKPLLLSKGDLTICVSDHLPVLFTDALASAKANAAKGSNSAVDGADTIILAASRPRLKFMDAVTAFKVSKQLYAFGRDVTLIPSSSLQSENLSNGPIIIVGAVNYPLSMMFQSKLRYSLRLDQPNEGRWIQDAQAPGKHDWKVVGAPENAKVDYGMVTRFWDSDTGGWVMMICGIGPFGTEAAANLVASSVSSKLLPVSIRSAGNFQIVLKTTVIDGIAGAPRILAVQTW